MKLTGRCYCGDIQYEFDGEVQGALQCHCRECQYISGGNPNVVMVLPESASRSRRASRRPLREATWSGRHAHFCPRCGTALGRVRRPARGRSSSRSAPWTTLRSSSRGRPSSRSTNSRSITSPRACRPSSAGRADAAASDHGRGPARRRRRRRAAGSQRCSDMLSCSMGKPADARRGRPARPRWRHPAARCSGASAQPTAPRFCISCSSLRAPMMTRPPWPLQQPVQGDLCVRPAGLGRDLVHDIDDAEQPLLLELGPGAGDVVRTRPRPGRWATPDLAGGCPSPAGSDHAAHALVARQRHQLPLVVAVQQRVVARGHVARQPCRSDTASDFIRCQPAKLSHRCSTLPAHQLVQRVQRLFHGRVVVLAAQLQQVDVVGTSRTSAPTPPSGAVATSRSRWGRHRPGTWSWSRSAGGCACRRWPCPGSLRPGRASSCRRCRTCTSRGPGRCR